MKHILFLAALLGLSLTSQALTVDEAIKLARKNSPRLKAEHTRQQAAIRSADAAGLWDNPELKFEAEGAGGDNDAFDQGEYAVMLKQTIPFGGVSKNKRLVAGQLARMQTETVSVSMRALDAQVRAAFAEALAQQEIMRIRRDQEKLGREFAEAAKERHEAGGASELEAVQADLALEEILLEMKCCFGDLDSARKSLASLTGLFLEELSELSGDFYRLASAESLTVDESHPAMRRLSAQEEMTRAEARQAKIGNTRNLSLGAGVKYEAADEAQSFVAAASIPLSIRKTGRLESEAALLRAEALRAERDQLQRDLQRELDQVSLLYRSAAAEAAQYEQRIIPKAEQAYALSRKGYEAGRYSWMEMLAAQQNLAGFQIQYVEAVLDAQKAAATLTRFKSGEEQ